MVFRDVWRALPGDLLGLVEPDQVVSDVAHELVERLRDIVRQLRSDAVWNCWVSSGAHGLSVRLQEARRVVPRGGPRDSSGWG